MPLDHYIPQVYLKNFYDTAIDKLHAYRKSDALSYKCNSKSQCRIDNGNTNKYLVDQRIIEDFLKIIEPKYNTALKSIFLRKIDADSVMTISGLMAYIESCSPAGMRIMTHPLRMAVETMTEIMEKRGNFPPIPAELGEETLVELIRGGKITIEIDEKYPQSIGIVNIIDRLSIIGNSYWDIILNETKDPFLTSDYPLAIENNNLSKFVTKIFPLSPNIAIRMTPSANRDRNIDVSFAKLKTRYTRASRSDVVYINSQIIKCAENTIYSSTNHKWIAPTIKKYSSFRVQCQENIARVEDKYKMSASLKVAKT